MKRESSESLTQVRVVSPEVAGENQIWVRDLSGGGDQREVASRRLYEVLLRAARSEAARRAARLRLAGPELDDIAHQAAADALLTICGKVSTFRGDCKFTTWAYKFVIFDVAAKINRHFWQRANVAFDDEDWERLPARLGIEPESHAESRDLMNAVHRAVDEKLTAKQRVVFVALVLNGMPTDVLADQLGATHNAIYKMMFDARRKLRIALVEAGYLAEQQIA
ncbi:RNA polymerase sigma-70 factor (ECF subfamily) [Kribbella sp. VKM Ac-2569]|uniref:sigma-70 family RNA polymerase sigma factor n=1 Tax=Kribbella sp. VKM Ac-2569 TaxID=2512220 RepID=UPI0010F31B11|nr:sigma-70 family RNA polymerase sigma factor [Kribbella sp. VKM Ac-2569]RZT07611.1 RNA polymerase sigma-70 factor (ECF subfamily) [Kribbella sp. VKM Ac-2569]